MASKAPKQWALTEEETITSFEVWKSNMIYVLGLDDNFKHFLKPGVSWRRKTKSAPFRGYTGDTAAANAAILELFLYQIAKFAPVIARSRIVKYSNSLTSIWEAIRTYYDLNKNFSNGGKTLHKSQNVIIEKSVSESEQSRNEYIHETDDYAE